MHLDYKEISRIHEKYYNPRIPSDQVYFRDPHNTRSFEFAVVCDNKDPEAQGRVKVYFPLYGENMISDWIPVLKQFAGPGKGFWALPDPGQKVICTFLENDMSMPIVMGSVYGPNCMPPIEDNTENNIKVLTSEFGSVIVMDDTEGAERLIVSMKDHQMRVVLDKETGLSIVNELGDIDISCRKFTVEGADTGTVTMSKGLSISTGENCAIKVSKGMEYKSGADVIVKGSAIELKANGTTAESKQIAAKDDQVVGVDVHIEMVVAGPALVPVPIPNPYIGILNDKLSADVKFNARPVATKGSKSLGVGPGHVLLSGVSFQKPPSNIGEVTSATIPSVMVNGKEVAVLSSAVKTCHDPVDAENCKIIAMGTAVPIPIQIPGLEGPLVVNTRSPIFEGEETPEERSLSNPMWGSSTAMVGEEIELSVSLVNQYEGAGVRFNIWEEGADRETDWPAAVVVGKNEGGRAAAKWIYRFQYDRNNPLTEKPKFVFTATSFGCEEVEAGVVEIHDNMVVRCVDAFGEILSDLKYSLPDLGTEGTSDADGIIREEDIPPGQKVIFDFTGFRKTGEKTTPDGPLNEEGKENKNFRIKDAQLEEGIFIDTFYATEIVFPTLVLRMAFDLTEFETEDDKYTLFSTDSNEYYRNELTCQDDRVEGDEYVDLHFVGVRRDINYSLEVEIGENEDRYFLFEDKFLDNLIR